VINDIGRRRELIEQHARAKRGEGDLAAIEAKISEAGYEYNARWNRLLPKDKNHLKAERALMKQGGFTLETWRQNLGSGNTTSCVGQGYATPVSDGRYIYVQTAFGGFFCFDPDGRRRWVASSPGQAGEYCRNGRSPLLWKNLLLSDITNRVRAFDKATGRLVWSDDGPARMGKEGASTVVSPAVIAVDGKDILYAAGNCAYLLPSGRRLKVVGWKDYGLQTLVKHDERDVVYFCGEGEHCGWTDKGKASPNPPAAVRFSLRGDSLHARVLWHGGTIGSGKGKHAYGGTAPWMLYHDGRFYHRNGAILDALTGGHIAGRFDRRGRGVAVPQTEHLLCVAGRHVFGLTRSGKMSVYSLDGRKVADNAIPDPAPGGKRFSFGCTFTFSGSDIYIRAMNHLIKVSPR
jgi:hypothetical protein